MEGLQKLVSEARAELTDCAALADLDQLRVRYLGKKGVLTEQLKALGKLPPEQRPQAGQAINDAKREVQQALEARKAELQQEQLDQRLAAEAIDVSLPGRGQPLAGVHPITRTLERIHTFFANNRGHVGIIDNTS